jgi:AraC-like DNA-binding protein
MQHIEFFDTAHFEKNYHRVPPAPSLSHLIDFFWETKFDHLWKKYPDGFSDTLFPNIGYTYLINLGSPFVMDVNNKRTYMKSDGFLPRHVALECHHQPGNILFGIKFKISPVIFEKKINFAEYKASIYPLSYLIEKTILDSIKQAENFKSRVKILNAYYDSILKRYEGSMKPVKVVSGILEESSSRNEFSVSIETLAQRNNLSSRTLQRYFEITTSLSGKKTLQVLRIRKAVGHLVADPTTFHYEEYGYYDHSHFYKHLKQFLQKNTLEIIKPHLLLLQKLHKAQHA